MKLCRITSYLFLQLKQIANTFGMKNSTILGRRIPLSYSYDSTKLFTLNHRTANGGDDFQTSR